MRVLYLSASGQIGGGNRSLLTLWDEVARHGITPLVICPADGPMVQACRDNGISCWTMNYNRFSWKQPVTQAQDYWRWCRVLKKLEVEIVHANSRAAGRAIALAAWTVRVPAVCHIRYPPNPKAAARSFRGTPKPDVFLFNSYALQAQVGEVLRRACPRTRQQVIYNGVNLKTFYACDRRTRQRVRVGIVANLLPVKGHDIFLAMAREVVSRGIPADFWIVGEDIANTGYRHALESLTGDLHIAGVTRFLGYRHDMPEVLAQIDILVSCSREEPFGRSLIEAMACELPVVAPAVGGIPEVVEDGRSGLLVPSENPVALADAVERLIRSHRLRVAMGKVGRQRVEKLFSNEAHAAAVMKVYESVVPGTAG